MKVKEKESDFEMKKEKEEYPEEIVWLAKQFHEVYEFQASIQDWNTQKSCRVPFEELPEKNRITMLETCKALIQPIKKHFCYMER